MPLNLCKGGNLFLQLFFSVNGVNLYNILVWFDYLDLKVADLTIDL